VNDSGQNDVDDDYEDAMPEIQEPNYFYSVTQEQMRNKFRRIVRVLRLIAASEKPLSKADIVRAIAEEKLGTERTVRDAIDLLLESGMIKSETNPGKRLRGGKPSTYFIPTRIGLENLISNFYTQNLPEFHDNDFMKLIEKYQHLVPEIFSLWPILMELGVDDIARRRLVSFFKVFHDGERLEDYYYRPKNQPTYGQHNTADWEALLPEYSCTPAEDVEAFLDPTLELPSERWDAAIEHNEKLRLIFIRGLLRKAQKMLHNNNEAFRRLKVDTIKLTGDDLKIYQGFKKEVDSLTNKISRSRRSNRR